MARRGNPSSTINANMTPMIDVTFLLIVFFVVVSQIVDRDAVSMDLPAPEHAVASIAELEKRVVVNIVPKEGGLVAGIVVGGHEIAWEALDELTAIVSTRLQGGAKEVHLRADRATKYRYIHQVIEAIREVGTTPRLQLVIDGEKP
ncbi:MAG: biopolymer transporter ExbD [Phycisphaerae bacterium]|jgi:biopolymer transport protein ExbD|nr:biopolymer transporter ExbD [Phycisphaerae bacterium]